MALTNAERQKRYRERIKAKTQGVTFRNAELETAMLRNELALLKLQASINAHQEQKSSKKNAAASLPKI